MTAIDRVRQALSMREADYAAEPNIADVDAMLFAYDGQSRTIERLTTENEKLTKALTTIAVYYETEYREGDKAYQAAIMAREAVRHEQ